MCQFTSIRVKKQRQFESRVPDDVKPERQLEPNNMGFCYNPACLSNLPLVVACDQFAAQISLSHVSVSHFQHLYLLQINKCLVSWQFFAAFCEANVCLCVCVSVFNRRVCHCGRTQSLGLNSRHGLCSVHEFRCE